MSIPLQKPEWIRKKITGHMMIEEISLLVADAGLHTVCQEALCPNIMECFSRRTATFLLLGPNCSRKCFFCAIGKDRLQPPDPHEPRRIAQAVYNLGLSFAVLTMVTRDDLHDGGVSHIRATIEAVRQKCPQTGVEVLISDLGGNRGALDRLLEMEPEVLNHNVETVPRLYPLVRPGADYRLSLQVIEQAAKFHPRPVTKSGLMLGLGETREEVLETMADLRKADCDIITIGQYLAPSRDHHPVVDYVTPEEFESLRTTALAMGFKGVVSGPFVRSSYQAEDLSRTVKGKRY